jgi:hypothetical protein
MLQMVIIGTQSPLVENEKPFTIDQCDCESKKFGDFDVGFGDERTEAVHDSFHYLNTISF